MNAVSPLSNSLGETTSHSTRLQTTAAKSLVIPLAGERTNAKGAYSASAPVNLLEIAGIIGEAAALKLVAGFGGQTVRIPAVRNVSADHPLARCIGIEALSALVKADGGRWLYVAKCYKGMIRQRNANIVRDYSAGVPVAELVRRYGPCDRQIWNILGSYVDDRQQSFF